MRPPPPPAAPANASPAGPDASATPARVLLCDDSAVIRAALTRMLESEPGIRVVARAANGQQAIEALRRQAVDVAVLDIEMPGMDGLTALPLLLAAQPGLRVVMASTLTRRGAEITLRALRLGAADYVAKPDVSAIADDSFRRELLAKVIGLTRPGQRRPASPAPAGAAVPMARLAEGAAPLLLAVASSTGGPQALFTLMHDLGPALPVPVVMTQHMPASFTPILAEHLGRQGGPACVEASDGVTLRPGTAYLAPGNRHLLIERYGSLLRARLSDAPPENYCRPSADPMLRSAAAACGGRVLVAMLTGMGHDGLAGTRSVVTAGGTALAQDEATSVVWGMPGAVAQAGLCVQVLPLGQIGGAIRRLLDRARDRVPA